MAAKPLNIADNVYQAQNSNVITLGDALQDDPWYQHLDDDMKNYLLRNLINHNDGSVINLGTAVINRAGISRVLDNADHRVQALVAKEETQTYEVKRKKEKFAHNPHIAAGYKKLAAKGFFEKLTSYANEDSELFSKTDTPAEIPYENVEGYQVHQTTNQTIQALANIEQQGGFVVGFDFESTAGVKLGEKQVPRKLTEFTFVKKNVYDDSDIPEIFSSIVGSSEEEDKEYEDIINKIERGQELSYEERVTATRLAKIGASSQLEGAIAWNSTEAQQLGIFTFNKFVGDDEVALRDTRMMRRGKEVQRKIGEIQRSLPLQDIKLDDKTFSVRGWETRLLKGVDTVLHGGKGGTALTAVGHNTRTFDISLLNSLITNGQLSEGAQEAMRYLFRNKNDTQQQGATVQALSTNIDEQLKELQSTFQQFDAKYQTSTSTDIDKTIQDYHTEVKDLTAQGTAAKQSADLQQHAQYFFDVQQRRTELGNQLKQRDSEYQTAYQRYQELKNSGADINSDEFKKAAADYEEKQIALDEVKGQIESLQQEVFGKSNEISFIGDVVKTKKSILRRKTNQQLQQYKQDPSKTPEEIAGYENTLRQKEAQEERKLVTSWDVFDEAASSMQTVQNREYKKQVDNTTQSIDRDIKAAEDMNKSIESRKAALEASISGAETSLVHQGYDPKQRHDTITDDNVRRTYDTLESDRAELRSVNEQLQQNAQDISSKQQLRDTLNNVPQNDYRQKAALIEKHNLQRLLDADRDIERQANSFLQDNTARAAYESQHGTDSYDRKVKQEQRRLTEARRRIAQNKQRLDALDNGALPEIRTQVDDRDKIAADITKRRQQLPQDLETHIKNATKQQIEELIKKDLNDAISSSGALTREHFASDETFAKFKGMLSKIRGTVQQASKDEDVIYSTRQDIEDLKEYMISDSVNQANRLAVNNAADDWEAVTGVYDAIVDVREKGQTAVKNIRTVLRQLSAQGDVFGTADIKLSGAEFGNASFDYHLDTLAVFRRFMREDFYDENDIDQMGQMNLTSGQQEAIVRRLSAAVDPKTGKRNWSMSVYDDPRNAGAAHAATTDTLYNLEYVLKRGMLVETSPLRQALSSLQEQSDIMLRNDGSELFLATSRINHEAYRLMTFTKDPLTGTFRFPDKYAISSEDTAQKVPGKVQKELVGSQGIQKGVTYRVKRLFEAAAGKEFHDIIKDMYPDTDISKLTVLELETYAPDQDPRGLSVRLKTPVYYIGTRQDIANAMMDHTFYIGNLQRDGTIDTTKVSDYTRKQLTKYTFSPEGVIEIKPFSAPDIVKEGAKRAEQEAAARKIRYHDYKADQKLLEFLDYEDKALGVQGNVITEEQRQAQIELYKRLWENSTKVAQKVFRGEPVDFDSDFYKNTYQNFFGFWSYDDAREGHLLPETLSGQLGRIDWARQNRATIQAAVKKAEELAGPKQKDRAVVSYYYRQLMQGVEDYIEGQESTKNSRRLGWQLDGLYGYEFENRFEINLKGFGDITKDTIVTLDLNSEPHTISNHIMNALAKHGGFRDDYKPEERAVRLKQVQKFLYDTKQIGHFTDGLSKTKREAWIQEVKDGTRQYSDAFVQEFNALYSSEGEERPANPFRIMMKDTETIAAHKLLQSFKNKREVNPFSGHITGTYRHMASGWEETFSDPTKTKEVLDAIGNNIATVTGVLSEKSQEIEKTIKDKVDDVVDHVLMLDDEPKIVSDLEKAGYSAEEIQTLKSVRNLHRQGLRRYTHQLFSLIGHMGGTITWDSRSRSVNAKIGDKIVDLAMPTERFIGGQLQYQVGGSLLSMPVGVFDLKDGYDERTELKMTSLIEKAVATQEGLIKWHKEQFLEGEGDALYHLEKTLTGLGTILRTAPVVKNTGITSRSNQFRVEYKDIFKNLPALLGSNIPDIDNWNTDEGYKQVIRELAAGTQEYDADHPAYSHVTALQANIDRLLITAKEAGIIQTGDYNNIITRFVPNVKMAEHLAGIATFHGDWYNQINGQKRNPANVEDAGQLDVKKISDYIGRAETSPDEFGALRDIYIGKGSTNLSTWRQATYGSVKDTDGTYSRRLDTHIQANVLHTSPMGLNALITSNLAGAAQALTTGQKPSMTNEAFLASTGLLTTAMPNEGVMFAHGQVFDRALNERDTLQKINVKKVLDINEGHFLDLPQKVAAMFSYDKQKGFMYGKGAFIQDGDVFAHIAGYSGVPYGKRAKYEGIFKLGVFDLATGHLVEEDEITRVIKESSDLADWTNLTDEKRARRIVDLLSQRYNVSYYIQTERANPLFKASEMSEKGMTRALILNTGEADTRVRNVMQNLGFYGGNYTAQEAVWEEQGSPNERLVQKQVTRTLGKVDALDIKMIDALKEGDLGAFGVAAKGRYQLLHGEELTDDMLFKTIGQEFGIDDVTTPEGRSNAASAFREAIIRERYAPSKVMAAVLQQADIYGTNDSFHFISNHIDNVIKHGDISNYRYLIDEWVFREKNKTLKGGTAAALVKKWLLRDEKGQEYKGDINLEDATLVLSQQPGGVNINLKQYREALLESGIVDLTKKGEGLSADDQKAAAQAYIDTGSLESGAYGFSNQTTRDFMVKDGISQMMKGSEGGPGNFSFLYEKSRGEFTKMRNYWDWQKESDDAVRFNQRAITALSNVRAGIKNKLDIENFYKEREKIYGESSVKTGDARIYDTYIKNLKNGEIVPTAAVDQIYRNMFNRQGGGEKLAGFIKDTGQGLEWGIDQPAVERFVKRYNVGNGDVQKGINIMTSILGRMHQDGMGDRSITTVNEAGALNLWKAFSATAANAINEGTIDVTTSPAEAERLGFKTIKLEDLMAGRFGAGDFEESLYGHNWLIDLGDHSAFKNSLWRNAGPEHKSGRYLAIAANHVEEPGAYREAIVDKPQAKVEGLQDAIDRYLHEAEEGMTDSRRQQLFDKITDKVKEIRMAQHDVWAGKKGIMDEATRAWMHDAQRATAKGMMLLGTENVETALGHANQVDNLQGLISLAKERKADISKLSINGLNLVEEAQKGKLAHQFNYSILSLERMNKIYDTGFAEIGDTLVNAGIDKDTVDSLISQMSGATKEIAQTEGVEGISAREPLQYYGSVTQRKIFFNSLASGNEAIGDFVSAQMRKEDYDSDAVTNALHKEQAELAITQNGVTKRVNIEVDSAMLSALNRMKPSNGIQMSVRLLDEGAAKRFENYKTSQFFLGAGEAQRYRVIQDFSTQDYNFNFNSFSADHLAERIAPYDSQLSRDVLSVVQMNHGQRVAFGKDPRFTNFMQQYYQDMVKEASLDQETFGKDFIFASGETQRIRMLEYLEKNAAAAGVLLGGGENQDLDFAYDVLKFSMHDKSLVADMVANAGRVPTGRINRLTQNVYDIMHEVLHNEGAEQFFGQDVGMLTGQIGLVNLAVQEGFLSPKNVGNQAGATMSAESLRTQLIPRLEKAFTAALSVKDNATDEQRAAIKKDLSDILKEIVIPRADNELTRDPALPTLLELMKDEEKTKAYGVNYKALVKGTLGSLPEDDPRALVQTASKAVDTYVNFLVDNVGWHGNKRNLFSFSVSHGSGNPKNLPTVLPRESNQASVQLRNIMGNVMSDLGVNDALLYSGGNVGFNKKVSAAQELNNFADRTAKQKPLVDISEVPKKRESLLRTKLRSMKTGGITGTLVNIAGGLMISGFANNPSQKPPQYQQGGRQLPTAEDSAFGNAPIPAQSLPEPATGLAAGGAAAYASQYPISLSDSNLNVMRGGPAKAYTINISGVSPRGQQAAVEAIQSSIGGPVPQNSSINIAINNNYQDTLSQAQVGRMVQTAMGF